MAESDRDRFHGDVVYEVWRSGGNPDAVDYDCTQSCYSDGVDASGCASEELRRQREPAERRAAEEAAMQEQWEAEQYEAAMEREQEEAYYDNQQEAQRAQEDQMPEAATVTFPHEARARVKARYDEMQASPEKGVDDDSIRDAMEVIEHLESDYKALTNTVEFMRDRVRAAIEPR